MPILTLDAALAQCLAAVVHDGAVVSVRTATEPRSQALLAPMAQAVMAEAGLLQNGADDLRLDAVAVTVGPGSFTGLRAALSLAHGIAIATSCPVVGVTVGEAIRAGCGDLDGRALWTAIDSRRGRVFLDRGPDADAGASDRIAAFDLASLPLPALPVAIAGDAAIAVAAALAAVGADVMLTDRRLPLPQHIAQAALARLDGRLPPRSAQPLYVDPPEAKLPAGGLRPAPLPADPA